VPATIVLGHGFGSVVVVNTDQGFIQSNAQGQLLYGSAAANIPTIASIAGVGLSPPDLSTPLAHVDTVLAPGATVNIGGSGFNGALVALFTPGGATALVPLPGKTSVGLSVVIPSDVPTGPAAVQVVNSPFVGNVQSNAVSVVLGAPLTLTSVTQMGSTITVTGTGFCSATVISFFNLQGMTVVNLGGYNAQGQPRIPLTVDPTGQQFQFTVPAQAMPGPAFVQAINPPFVPFTSTGADTDGILFLTP
jgi:hypothetical protein